MKQIIDKKLLYKKIINNDYTCAELAKELGLTGASFSRKLNNKISFNLQEIKTIKSLLNLSADEVVNIFLN